MSGLDVGDRSCFDNVVAAQEIIQDGNLTLEFRPGLTALEWPHHGGPLRRHSEYRGINHRAEKSAPHLSFTHTLDACRKHIIAAVRSRIR